MVIIAEAMFSRVRACIVRLRLFLLFLIGSCPAFHPACSSVMSMSNFRTNVLEIIAFIQIVRFPIFCEFSKPIIIHFAWSFHARLLILAHPDDIWISRMLRCLRCKFYPACLLSVMHLKVLDFYEGVLLLLHLLRGTCPVFHSVCASVTSIFNFCPNILQKAWEYLVSHFLRFLQAGYRLILFTRSFHARFLILAHFTTS